jgi:hypothetical protein
MIGTEYFLARSKGRDLYRFQDTVTSINAGLVSQFVNVMGGAFSVYMYSLMVAQFGPGARVISEYGLLRLFYTIFAITGYIARVTR